MRNFALLLVASAFAGAFGCSSTRTCVAKEIRYLDMGEDKVVCEPGWYPRRTGKPCGPDYEHVVLEHCHLEGWRNGRNAVEKEVEVFMPVDQNICDVRTQAGGLCFE